MKGGRERMGGEDGGGRDNHLVCTFYICNCVVIEELSQDFDRERRRRLSCLPLYNSPTLSTRCDITATYIFGGHQSVL